MSMVDVDEQQGAGPPPSDPGGGAGGDPGGGGPPGGGPVLASLMQQRQGPQVSAPGPGNQADAMMKVKAGIDMITAALPGLGTGTPIHTAALNALRQLSKHMAAGGPTAGVQTTMLQDLLRRTMQSGLLQRVVSQRAQQQPGREGAQPPMPSTPLPGA